MSLISCPQCQSQVNVPASGRFRCPSCKHVISSGVLEAEPVVSDKQSQDSAIARIVAYVLLLLFILGALSAGLGALNVR